MLWIAPPDLLVNVSRYKQFPQAGYLDGWKDVANTTVVNFMYDVTPAECLTFVICEHGCVTAEGVSNVMRMSGLDR
jgi:translation initiation factor 2B subunit (eIF-2B alpha/beta/delta family)